MSQVEFFFVRFTYARVETASGVRNWSEMFES